MELAAINGLITELVFYPFIFLGTLVATIIYPLYALFLLLTLDTDGAISVLTVDLWGTWMSFLHESWAVPYSWIYQFYALFYNFTYISYLIFVYWLQWAWLLVEAYFVWLLSLFNLTLEFTYDSIVWFANATYWTLHYIPYFSITLVQWLIEGSYETSIFYLNLSLTVLKGIGYIMVFVPIVSLYSTSLYYDWAN